MTQIQKETACISLCLEDTAVFILHFELYLIWHLNILYAETFKKVTSVVRETLFLCFSTAGSNSTGSLSVVSQILFSILLSYCLNTGDPQATALPADYPTHPFLSDKTQNELFFFPTFHIERTLVKNLFLSSHVPFTMHALPFVNHLSSSRERGKSERQSELFIFLQHIVQVSCRISHQSLILCILAFLEAWFHRFLHSLLFK